MSIFEKASRQQLRFNSSKGMLTTEDLWQLSLESLDSIAKTVNKKLKSDSEESFIGKRTKSNTESELQLDILKHIISVKLAEDEARKTRTERTAKIAQLKELATAKEGEELKGKSKQEILAMIANLQNEDELLNQ